MADGESAPSPVSHIGRPVVTQLIGLFPTPVMRVEGLVAPDQVEALAAEAADRTSLTNAYSDLLSHTPVTGAQSNTWFERLGNLVLPKVAEFGEVLFGEALNWQIKEIWVNVLEPGDRKSVV